MNSKERMNLVFDHKETDRVPYQVFFVPEWHKLLLKKYCKEIEEISSLEDENHQNIKSIELDIVLDHDIIELYHDMSLGYCKNPQSETFTDDWGITWKKIYYNTKNGSGQYNEIIKHPLSDESLINEYIPPTLIGRDLSYEKKIIKKYGKDNFIFSTIGGALFEGLKYLRGDVQGLIDIASNKDICNKILDITVDYHLKLGFKFIELGVDMLYLADDYGGENGTLISPESFREIFKPRMGYLIDELRKKKKDIKFALHSCGNIYSIIDDFIEIGVDILHPIQPEVMNPYDIKKRFGKRIVLWGSISQQRTMPFGSPREVGNEVRTRINEMAPGGGFIIAPAQAVQLDTSLENIEAFYCAVKEYGNYSK